MKQDFEKLLQEKKQERELSSQSLTTERDTIAIVVDDDTYNNLVVDGINLLEQYIDDVHATFPEVDLILKKGDFARRTGVQMREQLRIYWEQDHIDGAVLVGLIPYMVWKQQLFSDWYDQRGPCHLCFEDLDGSFEDTDGDRFYDTHEWRGEEDNIEIWVSWIRPPVTGATVYLREFFQKTHRYYQEPEPKGYRKETLFYGEMVGRGDGRVGAVRDLIAAGYREPLVVDYNTLRDAKILSSVAFVNEIARSPEFAFLVVHGSPWGFGLYPEGTGPDAIRGAGGGAVVTWGNSCSLANFYLARSGNVLQSFVFGGVGSPEMYNQAAIGLSVVQNWSIPLPLSSGGFAEFFSTFFSGGYLGQAWYGKGVKDAAHRDFFIPPEGNIPCFLLIGNPFVRHRGSETGSERPVILDVSPRNSAHGGEIVEIRGEHLGSAAGEVLFDGFEAEVLSWGNERVLARLPAPSDSLASHLRVWAPDRGNSLSWEFNYHRVCHGEARHCLGFPTWGRGECHTTGLSCGPVWSPQWCCFYDFSGDDLIDIEDFGKVKQCFSDVEETGEPNPPSCQFSVPPWFDVSTWAEVKDNEALRDLFLDDLRACFGKVPQEEQ